MTLVTYTIIYESRTPTELICWDVIQGLLLLKPHDIFFSYVKKNQWLMDEIILLLDFFFHGLVMNSFHLPVLESHVLEQTYSM